MLCSSLMLIANKLAIYFFKAPSILLILQLGLTAVCVKSLGLLGVVEVDDLEWSKVKPYTLVALAFVSTIFTGVKTLQYANVETFIVFRASTPLLVSVADWIFLGRELPSYHSMRCLMGLLLGAIGYVLYDDQFEIKGYLWVAIWYMVFCFDQIYLKHASTAVKMKSNWGKVYYSNLLACVPLLFNMAIFREDRKLSTFTPSMRGVSAVLLSCVIGVAMSYFAWLARTLVSATKFTVVGNACKILTVLINRFIWDKHANNIGLFCLGICLLSAYYYKEAPKRAPLRRAGEKKPLDGVV